MASTEHSCKHTSIPVYAQTLSKEHKHMLTHTYIEPRSLNSSSNSEHNQQFRKTQDINNNKDERVKDSLLNRKNVMLS